MVLPQNAMVASLLRSIGGAQYLHIPWQAGYVTPCYNIKTKFNIELVIVDFVNNEYLQKNFLITNRKRVIIFGNWFKILRGNLTGFNTSNFKLHCIINIIMNC